MMTVPLPIVLLAGLLSAPPGPSGGPGIHRHDVSPRAHLDLGRAAGLESVCRIEKDGVPSDSCVLIASRWVVSAGHTVHLARGRRLTVHFDSDAYTVERTVIHPDFTWGVDFGVDLALLRLDREAAGVTPAVPYVGEGEVGQQATLAGWGVFGGARAADAELQQTGSHRTAGHNMVDALGGLTPQSTRPTGYLIMDFDAPDDPSLSLTGSDRALPLEFAFTGGDSGGGVFLTVDGRYRLAGIISVSEHPEVPRRAAGRYGSKMYAVRLPPALDWITSTVADGRPGLLSGPPAGAGPPGRGP